MFRDVILSIERRDLEQFYSLVKSVSINGKDEYGDSILHSAIATGLDEAAIYFINNNGDLNIQDNEGNTALHYCAEYNNLIIAKLLADKGARFDISNRHENEPLWAAVFSSTPSDQGMLDLFLQYTNRVNTVNKYGKTPLDFAIAKGDYTVIKALESKR